MIGYPPNHLVKKRRQKCMREQDDTPKKEGLADTRFPFKPPRRRFCRSSFHLSCFLFFCVGAQGRLVLLFWKEAVTGRGLRTRSGDELDSLLSLLLFFSLSFISFFSLPQFSDPAHQLSLFLHSVRRSLPVGNA